jgi:hypothetical protein
MEELFKTGGFALSFGFSGLVLMIVAAFRDGHLQFPPEDAVTTLKLALRNEADA